MKRKSKKQPRRPVLETIEPRILDSADFSPGLVDASAVTGEAEHRTLESSGEFAQNWFSDAQLRRHEIVFVDTATPDYARLIEDLRARDAIEVVLLDAGEDGVKQITEALAARRDISAVHLVSHGSDGSVQLGASTLNFGSLLKNATQIKRWSQALTADADLLIYGCNVAATQDGKSLVDALARLTGADVAASDDLTGTASRGGDWDLEFHAGRIDISIVFSQSIVLDWNGTLQSYAVGGETLANTFTSNAQQNDPDIPQSVAMDANGNYVVVWSGRGTSDNPGIFAQRYNASGVAQGAEFRVNTTIANTQSDASVAMDGNGNFVVAWTSNGQDGSGTGIYAQRYNAAGVAQGAEFRVNSTTANAQIIPMVAMDAAGNFVIAWQSDLQDGGGAGVYAQRYSAAGVVQGGEFLVNITTAGNQYLDDIAMDAAGNFIVTYSSPLDSSGDGVYMRRYNAAGTALSGEVRVNTTIANDQNWSSVAMAPSGEFVVTWRSNTQDGSLGGIYAQRFNAAGVAQGGEFLVNTTTSGDQGRPVVAIGTDGSFVIAWQSNGQDSPGTSGIYKQEYNADGTANGVETLVNTTVAMSQANPSIAISGTGAFVVSWSGNGTGDSDGVYWQRYVPALYVDTASDVLDGTTTSISALLANKGADGFISLREAITAANNTANIGGPDRIYFNIAGAGPHTITLTYDGPDGNLTPDALPTISQALIIDGTTEPDFAGTPVIEINGNNAVVNGLTISAGGSGSTVRGLAVNRFTTAGILVQSANNVIAGNFLGTDVSGTIARPNAVGVLINSASTGNRIGGTTAADRNIISGNSVDGIQISGAGVSNNMVQGNYIGLDVTGTLDLGNTNQGVAVFLGAQNNTIGGTAAGAGNVLSGNNRGVLIGSAGTTGNVVQGNLIGTNAAGTTGVGNSAEGIFIDTSAANNTIGGTAAGAANTIAYNASSGVMISSTAGTGNSVAGNAIFSNGGLGIDLWGDGVTANDVGDGDSGPNALQNYPVLLAAASAGGFTTITGTLNSTASATFTVHFYSSPAADGSGYGEGQVYLGSTSVTTDASGNAVINAALAVSVTAGHVITATATSATNSTSEFSAAITATAGGMLVVDTVSDTADGNTASLSALYASKGADGRISLREAIVAANNTVNAGTADLVRFNILGAGPHTINLASALPDVTDAVSIDGTTDPDFTGTPIIELNGAGTVGVNGLNLIANGNTIRGLIINRFDVSGIQISSSTNVIVGNWIGINSAGTADAGNSDDGITISGDNNIIGGTTAADRNVISGNDDDGLDIDPGFIGNVIIGNWIGTNATNSGTIGNGVPAGVKGGVRIEGDNNRVGGTAANEANVIRGNWSYGVYLWGTGNQVLGNSIYGNQQLGIDLNQDGVTANDGAKSPGQPNLLMDFPVIQSAALNGTTLTVRGYIGTTLDDTDFAGARVEFFESPDAAGANGEGQTYLGFLIADANGNFSGSFTVGGLPVGDRVTGTATDGAGNTSEFGVNVAVVDGTPLANADSYSVNEDGTLSVPGASQWWNTSWTQRQQLTFNNLAQAENLVDFPVLVQLDSSRVNYALTQNAGQDLRFVDADGTLLAYEIERWNELGTSYVWVKVPQIDGSSGADHIWMYYGNASAPAGQNPTAVWTSSFSAVYHMNDGSATIQDSSSNNFDGTALAGAAGTTGYAAGGQTLDGVDDRIDMGANRTFVSNVSGATLSAWISTDTVAVDQSIISLSVNNGAPTSTSRAALELTGDDIKVIGRSTDAEAQMVMSTTGNVLAGAVGAWHYLTGVVDYAN
ncbi:MAG TPA: DUF2341 domain-containing protein, partial [Burkholderiales bacterium]|nr:DUF2341 domain-containing protein [Burkholderiales bacterium]